MNNLIKELAEQATRKYDRLGFEIPFAQPDLELFAELIVLKCAELCYNHSMAAGGEDTTMGYGYKDCGDDIKSFFGVK
jgi:hypothetical protein